MASIKIPIGTDNTGLDAGAAKAEKRMNKFKGAVVKNFAAIASAVGIVGVLDKLSERLDRIGKLSRRGLDVDFLQKLDVLAETSGSNVEAAAKAVSMLVKEIRSADGPASEVAATLQALGLSVDDLRQLGAQDLFVAVATAIGNLDDETDQLAATTGLMGARYADMLPLIQDLAQRGMPEFTGATRKQIREVEAANDAWTIAKMTLSTKLAPVLILVSRLAQTFSLAIESATNKLVIFSGFVIGNAMGLKLALEGIFDLDQNKIKAGIGTIKDNVNQTITDAKKDLKGGMADLKAIWTSTAFDDDKAGSLTGDKKYKLPGSGGADEDVLGDEGRAAIAAHNKIARERRKAREDARRDRESARQDKIGDLKDEGRDIAGGIRGRLAALNAPSNITVSSMRSIGGGGGVALPNEQKVLRVNEAQLKRLGEIFQELKRLNMQPGGKAFK